MRRRSRPPHVSLKRIRVEPGPIIRRTFAGFARRAPLTDPDLNNPKSQRGNERPVHRTEDTGMNYAEQAAIRGLRSGSFLVRKKIEGREGGGNAVKESIYEAESSTITKKKRTDLFRPSRKNEDVPIQTGSEVGIHGNVWLPSLPESRGCLGASDREKIRLETNLVERRKLRESRHGRSSAKRAAINWKRSWGSISEEETALHGPLREIELQSSSVKLRRNLGGTIQDII